MDLWSVLGLVARRWYVLVAGLAATAVLTFVVVSSIAPTYRAQVDLLLFMPTRPAPDPAVVPDPVTVEQVRNPFLEFGSLQPLAEVVARVMMNDTLHERLLEGHPLATDYTVERDTFSAAPLLMVYGDASTEEGALAFAEAVAAETQTQIQTQQRGVGAEEDAQVMAQSVTPQPVAEEQTGSRLRALVALSALGLAVSVGACFVVDGAVSAAALKRALGRQRGEGAGGRPSGANAPPAGAGVACGVCGSAVCDDPEHALHLLETALLADRGGADDRRGGGSAAPDPFEDFLPPWRSGRSSR